MPSEHIKNKENVKFLFIKNKFSRIFTSPLNVLLKFPFPYARHHPVEGEKFRLSIVRHPPVTSNSIQFLLQKILSTPSPVFLLHEYIPLLLLLLVENRKTATWHRLDDVF